MRYLRPGLIIMTAVAAPVLISGCAGRKATVELYPPIPATPYDTPLISPGAKFASLSPAVQHTIRAQAGTTEIEDIVKDTHTGTPVYRVYFVNHEVFPPLYVAADGSVLNPDLSVAVGASRDTMNVSTGGPATGLTQGDLPPNVVRVIQRQAPYAEIDTITKEMRKDQAAYVITFKGRSHPKLVIAADATVLTE